MKYLFIVNSFEMGGAEKHTLQLAAGLVERGDTVIIDALRDGNHYAVPDARIQVRSSRGNGLAAFAAMRRLADFIARERPDIVVGINHRPLYMAHIGRRLSGVACPVVLIHHSTKYSGWRVAALEPINRPMANRADLIIYVSSLQRDWWRAHGYRARRDEVVLNGVDATYFTVPNEAAVQAARQAHGFEPGELVIGLCAALRPEKNPLQLLDAVAALRHGGMPVRALVVGDGAMGPAMRDEAHKRGLTPAIVFAGALKDVRPALAAIDVGVLCSVAGETFSLAALEMMAMGRPVVLSDTGGAREMVQDGVNGYLFPIRDTAKLVAAINALGDRAGCQRLGMRARDIVETRFTPAGMIDQYRQIFHSIVHRP